MVVRCLFLQCLIVSVTEFPWRQTYSPSVRIRADEASGTERTVEMRHSWELAVAGLPASRLLHTVGGTNRPFLEGPGGGFKSSARYPAAFGSTGQMSRVLPTHKYSDTSANEDNSFRNNIR